MRGSTLGVGLFLALISFIVKLPYLGTFLTIDEPRWIKGAGKFALGLHTGNLSETYWHFHPGITITWGETLILWLQSLSANHAFADFVDFQIKNPDISVGAMRLSGVILTSLAIPFVYWLAKRLAGKWAAILGVGLLAVDPFWVAHSRIVNGDALAAVLMFVSYLAFVALLNKPDQKLAVLSGVFMGLSFLTKLPSQILLLAILLIAIIGYSQNRDWRFWLKALALWSVSGAIIFIALWPAMWVEPIETLKAMYVDTFEVGDIGGKDKVEFFWGNVIEKQSPFFYPAAILFRLTPVNLAGFVLAFGLLFLRKKLPSQQTIILMFVYIVMVIVLANVSPKKADRYAMAVIPAINLLTGTSLVWLSQKITNRYKPIKIVFVVSLLILGQFLAILLNYPYILTYYNPLLGGYAKAAEIIPVGRGEGLEQAAVWINNQPDGATAKISPYYRNVSNPYLNGKSLGFSKTGQSQILADYIVFYITQIQRKLPYPGLVEYYQQQIPVHTIYFGKTPYVWIYKNQLPVTKLEGKPKITGRADLIGYNQSEETLMPGGKTDFVFYFISADQELPDNEDFKVSLVDGLGREHGIWKPDPANQWRSESLLEWKGTLFLPETLPPDNYRLKVSLIDINLNSEVAFFPFEDVTLTVKPPSETIVPADNDG